MSHDDKHAEQQQAEQAAKSLERPLRAGPEAWQQRWHEVIFEADTPEGKWFDLGLMIAIVASIVSVMLESVESIQPRWGTTLAAVEWVITLLFTCEYAARLACVARPSRYALSFFGLVDLVSILPSYLALVFTGAHMLATIRMLRLLRVFRVLKMARHLSEARTLLAALRQTWPKITVFMTFILCAIVILGTVMHLIEGEQAGGRFHDIPTSVYWAITTITTVGYGDIVPQTALGRLVATIVMLLGYAVIIVPTGIFSAEVISGARHVETTCPKCGRKQHESDSLYCATCGAEL